MSVPETERLARVALSRLGEPGETKMTSLTAELGPERLLEVALAETELDGLRDDVASRVPAADPAL